MLTAFFHGLVKCQDGIKCHTDKPEIAYYVSVFNISSRNNEGVMEKETKIESFNILHNEIFFVVP